MSEQINQPEKKANGAGHNEINRRLSTCGWSRR